MLDLNFYQTYKQAASLAYYTVTTHIANEEIDGDSVTYNQYDFTIAGVADVPNAVFTSIPSALAYAYSQANTGILGAVNSYFGSAVYQVGSLIDFPQKYQSGFNGKQASSPNLDVLSNLTVTTAAQNMMDGSDYGPISAALATPLGGAMGLNTAAFHPDTDFATPASVATAIANLVNSAPGTLDTLGEIATALASDESTAAALATTVGNKVDKTTTINGHALSSNVTVTKGDVGLGNVDNTADSSKTFSASQITSGTKTSAFISDFGSAARAAAQIYSGTTQKLGAFPIFKSGTVASGVIAFHLTTDGTSGGAALFPTGPEMSSIGLIVNDATASYQFGWAWSNSNKTLTVTANKLTTANILTGILGQSSANGSTVYLTVWGN